MNQESLNQKPPLLTPPIGVFERQSAKSANCNKNELGYALEEGGYRGGMKWVFWIKSMRQNSQYSYHAGHNHLKEVTHAS